MKKKSTLAHFLISSLMIIGYESCGNADKPPSDIPMDAENSEKITLASELQQKIDTATLNAFETVIKNSTDNPLAIQYLGHYAYLNRHLELAAWLYARANEKKPDDINNQSNLALCLHELSVEDSSANKFLQEAIDILEKAANAAPGNAAVQNNLGYAYYQKHQNSNDPGFLDKAEAAFKNAIMINPDNSVFYSHLADVEKAKNKQEEAISNLNRAFRLSPYDGVYITSTNGFKEYFAAKSSRSFCDSINFNCMKNCPPSIIGRIKVINCEIAQQDAQMACAAGEPYALSFNCDDEIPATGFMIPGLQSGIGIITPWGKLGILVQGGGNIDVKIEVNTPVPSVRVSGSGRYNPSSGMSVTEFGTQASINLYNRGIVAPVLNKLNIGPAGVKFNVSTNQSNTGLQLEAYDTPIVHIH